MSPLNPFTNKYSIEKEQHNVIIYSNNFINILNKINDNISNRLLLLVGKKSDITYIDIMDENNISYVQSKLINSSEKNYWIESRSPYKIGRFVKKLLDDETNTNIEQFVNKYKAAVYSLNNFKNFKIVEGDDIVKYYNGKSYKNGQGPLNKSCMRHNHCEPFFDFYKYNNDKVKMIVLYDNDEPDKIIGRSLLWKVDEPNIMVMDRIYATKDSDSEIFINYAKKNKWYYKKTQSFDEVKFINPFDNEEVFINCKIFIDNNKYNYYPYLDTFYYYDQLKGYLTNNKKEYSNNKNIVKLRATDGRDQGNSNFVYDKYNNDFVKVTDTEYCSLGDTRTLLNNIIKLNNIYSTPTYIRHSNYDNKLYAYNEVLWSDTHRTYISINNSFKVYFDNNMEFYDYIHSDFNGEKYEFVKNKNSYFIKDIVIKGYDNNFYLKTEYNENEIKSKIEQNNIKTIENWDMIFDDFIKTISKKEMAYKKYGVFK